MYKSKALCLALGLPTISFYARPQMSYFFFSLSPSQVGTAGGWSVVRSRVQRGKEGLLTLCRWAGAVVCSAPNGVAGQLSWSLSGRLSCRPGLPRASQGQNQVRARPEVQVQVSCGAANRIESDRGWIRQDWSEDPFSTLYPCDLIGSRRRLLGDFVTGYFNGTRREPSIYSVR